MTIKELYALCDNLGPNSLLTIRKGHLEEVVENDIHYKDLAPFYWDMPVKGFKITSLRCCTIYI